MPWAAMMATTLIAFLAEAIKGLVGRVLVALGIGVVVATGVSALLSQALGLMSFGSAGGAQFQAALSAIGIPWFLGTIVSAITTRVTLRGLSSDGLSFWIMRRQLG